MIVRSEVARERFLAVGCRDKAFRAQNFGNAAFEASHHPIGLLMAGLDEPMRDALFRTELI